MFLSTNHITNLCLCIYGIHTCIHTYIQHTYMHTYMHTYIQCTYICTCICVCACARVCSFVCSFSCLFVVRLSLCLLFVCSVLTDNYTYGSFRKLGGTLFCSPKNRDPTIWGTILGFLMCGNSHIHLSYAPAQAPCTAPSAAKLQRVGLGSETVSPSTAL